jgi:hypothetical protein
MTTLRNLFLLSALGFTIAGFTAHTANAAVNLGFNCDVQKANCSCDINTVGDCDKMKKNCVGDKISTCKGLNCSCTMKAPAGSLQKIPMKKTK